jgi:hypothetical protein
VLGPHRRTIQREEAIALQDAVDDRVREVFVMQHAPPLVQRFIRGEDHRALLPMPIVDDVKEHIGGVGAAREVADFVNKCGAPHLSTNGERSEMWRSAPGSLMMSRVFS